MSEIARLFNEWRTLIEAPFADEQVTKMRCDAMRELAGRLIRSEPQTAAEMAAIYVAVTQYAELEPTADFDSLALRLADTVGPACKSESALDGDESLIVDMARGWQRRERWINTSAKAKGIGDDRLAHECDLLAELEERLLAIPSLNARDVLAKLLVVTLDGSVPFVDSTPRGEALLAEARAFAGLQQ